MVTAHRQPVGIAAHRMSILFMAAGPASSRLARTHQGSLRTPTFVPLLHRAHQMSEREARHGPSWRQSRFTLVSSGEGRRAGLVGGLMACGTAILAMGRITDGTRDRQPNPDRVAVLREVALDF